MIERRTDFASHLQRFNAFWDKAQKNPASPQVDEWLGKAKESFGEMTIYIDESITRIELLMRMNHGS